jgi:hypothetical protein
MVRSSNLNYLGAGPDISNDGANISIKISGDVGR